MNLRRYHAGAAFVGMALQMAAIFGCHSPATAAPATPTTPAAAKITVDAAHPAHAISPTLWGIFFEDINLFADGGIYPELVRNRSFEDSDKLEYWKFTAGENGRSEASVVLADVQAKPPVPPLNPFNRKSLRLRVDGSFTLQNEGYWGMNIVSGDTYALRFAARSEDFDGKLTAGIVSSSGAILAHGEFSGIGRLWK